MVQLNIKSSTDNKFSVDVDLSITVAELKNVLAEKGSIPSDQQRIIYSGRILKDNQTLQELKIQEGHTLHLVRGSAPPPPPPIEQQVPNPQTNQQANTIPGMPSNIQNMMNNPMVESLLNSPMMDNLFSNPDFLREAMMNNPEMREVINNNPEMRQVLNDPQTLRQTLEMMRNPELMREMMRNADRAMINIENHPEGFNLLRRMYTNVQEPLLNAASQNQTSNPNPFSNLFNNNPNPNNQPLPNPWQPQPQANNTTPTSPTTNASGTTPTSGTTNTGATNNPFGNFGGLGGLGGMGGMGGMGGLNMNPEQISQMLSNPMVQASMQQMAQNPQLFQSMIDSDPRLREMAQSNPGIRDMFSNPEFLQMFSNPQNLQAMLQMQQSLSTLTNNGMFGGANTGGANPFANFGGFGNMANMGNMFGGLNTGTNQSQPSTQNQEPPEIRYQIQITQLEELGFLDRQANITALTQSNGNINGAIDRLLR